MINNVVLVSGVRQSDSVIRIHVSILFQILFPFGLLQSVEQSSPRYTDSSFTPPDRWLSTLNIAVCAHQSQHPPIHPLPAATTSFILQVCESASVLQRSPLVSLF